MRPRRARGQIAAALTLGVILLAGTAVASADKKATPDPNDTPGLLDIRAANAVHRGRELAHTIKTHESWKIADLGSKSRLCLFVFLSDDPLVSSDYALCARAQQGKLVGVVYDRRGETKRTLRLERVTDKSVTLIFPQRTIDSPRVYYWRTRTDHRGNRDLAPDRPPPEPGKRLPGLFEHRLR